MIFDNIVAPLSPLEQEIKKFLWNESVPDIQYLPYSLSFSRLMQACAPHLTDRSNPERSVWMSIIGLKKAGHI